MMKSTAGRAGRASSGTHPEIFMEQSTRMTSDSLPASPDSVLQTSKMVSIRRSADGSGHHLRTEIVVDRPRAEVFGFFADAANLEAITPPWLHFQITTPPPIEMREDALIDYRLRLHGIPLKWRTRISAWEPPQRFIDEQIRGPYLWWRHEHQFFETDAGTVVQDDVHYGVPFGWLLHPLLVRRDLRRIFRYRTEQIAVHFSGR